jgi:hypothetical protein
MGSSKNSSDSHIVLLLLLGYVLTIDSYSTYNIYCTTLYTRSNDLTFLISKHFII